MTGSGLLKATKVCSIAIYLTLTVFVAKSVPTVNTLLTASIHIKLEFNYQV